MASRDLRPDVVSPPACDSDLKKNVAVEKQHLHANPPTPTTMAPNATIAPAKSPAESPYKLEPAQVLKASEALLKHMRDTKKQSEANGGKRNLLTADDDEEEGTQDANAGDAESIWLIFTTKKHITDTKKLKPKKIEVPHTLNVSSAVSSICLITPSPQRAFKDVVENPAFPKELGQKLRVLGVDKVKARFKSFEQRRQLREEYDIFLADDRIITMLPGIVGKVLYQSTTTRPLPVTLSAPRPKDANGKTIKAEKKILSNKRTKTSDEDEISVATPEAFARQIERTLSSAQIHLSASTTTSVRVGYSSFAAKQLAENVEAVVKGMVENIIPQGWRNVKALHVKGPNSAALPIWLASELWAQEEDVLEDADATKVKALQSQKGRKRKDRGDKEERVGEGGKKQKKQIEAGISSGKDAGFSKEMTERREKLRQAKREAKQAIAAGA